MAFDPPAGSRDFRATFPSTAWSVVLAAGNGLGGAQALDELCRAYWPPLYSFLRRQGHSVHDAEDIVQSYLARLLARDDLREVSPEKGSFRTFLLTSLRNFAIKTALSSKAVKRGAGRQAVSIDHGEAERICGPDLKAENPEQAFDRRWAATLLARALHRLRQEQRARGKESLFEALAPYLDGAERGEYQLAATQLGLAPGTVAVSVHRLRARLQELVRVEVAQTVTSAEQVEHELRCLRDAWVGSAD